MRQVTFVQIYECAGKHRRATHRLPVGMFMRYAMERLPARDVMQLRNDLTAFGRSESADAFGRRHEYELVSDTVE